jgi:hypothetical protein
MSVCGAKKALAQQNSTPGDDQNTIAHPVTVCDVVSGVGVPDNGEVQLLTTFRNEACDQVTVCGDHYARSSTLLKEPSLSDIKEYLGRPNRFYDSTFNEVVPGVMYTLSPTIANFDPYNRLNNVYGVRATLCFRLQVAATPFQAGVIRMAWQPQVLASDVYYNGNTRNQISMLPGVNLDVCEMTSAVLRVPFVSCYNYYPVKLPLTGQFYIDRPPDVWGTFTLFAYLPLTIAAGGGNPLFNVYTWLEDVELLSAAPTAFTNASPQAGDGEAKAVDKPLSAMLNAAARVVSVYGGFVPLISSYVGPTSWFLRQGAKLASTFGFSKPLDVQTVSRMQITSNTYQHNCDGFNVAYNMGLFSDNTVSAESGFAGSDLDEMSFDYLLSVPAAICSGTISNTDLVGQAKYACAVCPRSMWFTTFGGYSYNHPDLPTSGTNTAVLSTPLFYLGNMFSTWHGDIKFTIRVAKTKFHAGRLLLSYSPAWGTTFGGVSSIKVPSTTELQTYNYKSAVWDLRESNVIEFVCPFVSPVNYNFCQQPTGVFVMSVLDPLLATSTVSPSVPFIVEVSGMPGFEFTSPCTPTLCPAPVVSTTIYSQSGTEVVKSQFTPRDALMCIGERITSVKQLISKACPDANYGGVNRPTAPFYCVNYPTWSANALVIAPPTSTVAAANPLAWCRYLSLMYAYARGGTVYHALRGGSASSTTGYLYGYYQNGSQVSDGQSGLTFNSASNAYVSENSALHLAVPFYSPTSRVLRSFQDGYPAQGGPGPAGTLRLGCNGTNVGITVFANAADDAQLGYFIGTPPLALSSYSPVAYDAALLTGLET